MAMQLKIKEKVFNYYQKKQPTRTKHFRNYNDIRRILILFESDWLERHLQVKQLIREMQGDGKEVVAWGYVNKVDRQTPILRDFRVFGKKEINWFERPKTDVLTDFMREEFDVLIDLTIHPVLPLRYMALYAKADCKLGKAQPDLAKYLHDFMINLPEGQEDAAYLFDQIKHYLTTIQTA